MLEMCDISGSAYIGMFGVSNPDTVLIPHDAPRRFERTASRVLGVETLRVTVGGGRIIGALICMNSRGMLVSDLILPEEMDILTSTLGRKMNIAEVENVRLNAFGNTVLANDRGAIIHPDYDDEFIRMVKDVLEVDRVERGTIAGSGIVGSCGVANSRGALLHPGSTRKERETVANVLGVEVNIATANRGCPHLHACALVNDTGVLLGTPTTTVEVDRFYEVLCK